MGDPRNPARANELWDSYRLEIMNMEILTFLCRLGALSGGWAWHYMSPPHLELKLHHDHKDVDMFVEPDKSAFVIAELKQNGYKRITTVYDDPSGDFYRFEKHEEGVKIIVDLFVEAVPVVELPCGVKVVEPTKLLTYYSKKKHTTDDCTAVRAARELLDKGVYPVGREELCQLQS